jgi:DNA primase
VVYFQEKETIRLLLNYADEKLDNQKLADFLVNELEEVNFTHPVYQQIYLEFVNANKVNLSVDSSFFLQNANENIRKEVSSLVVSKYHASPNWIKSNIFFPKDGDELDKKALSNVLHLKYRIVRNWIEDNKELLKGINDEFKELEILEKQMQLTEMDRQIASQLTLVSGKY